MHTSTISDQTDRSGTGPALRYNSTGPDKYLSDSDSYNDNDSNCGSDDYKFIITTSLIMSPIMKKLPALQPALPKL